jgi:hypothetical protein
VAAKKDTPILSANGWTRPYRIATESGRLPRYGLMRRSVAKVSQTSQSQNEEDIMNVPIGIDINGLNDIDKARISQIGVWKWMDEICNAVRAPRRELPASVPSSTRLCKAGKRV